MNRSGSGGGGRTENVVAAGRTPGGRTRVARAPVALALTAVTILMAGCSLLRRGDSGDAFARSGAGRQVLEIVVINLNYNDATIWVVSRAGKRVRLGMVTGKDEGHFTIPWTFSEPMALEIDMVAGPRCVSDTLTADPGDVIELRIDVAFSQSSACRSRGSTTAPSPVPPRERFGSTGGP